MNLAFATQGKIVVVNANSHEHVATLAGHNTFVNQLKFHPLNENLLGSGGDDQTARVWDIAAGTEIARFQHGSYANVYWISFGRHYDGSDFFVTRSSNYQLHKWDLATNELMFTIKLGGMSSEICVCLQGKYILTVIDGSEFIAWDSISTEPARDLVANFLEACATQDVAMTKYDGLQICPCAGDDSVAAMMTGCAAMFLRFSEGAELTMNCWKCPYPERRMKSLALSGDAFKLFCFFSDNNIAVLDTASMTCTRILENVADTKGALTHTLAANIVGDRIVFRHENGQLIVVDTETEAEIHRFVSGDRPQYSIHSVVLL